MRRKLPKMETEGAPASADDLGRTDIDSGAVVRAFLIADVRGYTSFTHTHGDEEAGKLAQRFAALAREAVTATGGEVIELRGDEALCVFPSARQALRAAVELQIRFRRRVEDEPVFPLGIGIGLAAGEAVPVEGGYRGGALNLAARLCSLAGPGQILASETVTSLAGRLEGVRFVERRPVRVKGLEKPVRAIEVVPEIELPPLPDTRRPSARRRRVFVAAAGAAVLAAALAVAGLTLSRDSDEAVEGIGNAIAAIGSDDNAVHYTEAGNTPSTIAIGEGAVWVLNADDRTISKIDPETSRIVKTFGTGGTTTDLAVGEDAVWIGNGSERAGVLRDIYTESVSRLDPVSTVVTGTVPLPAGHSKRGDNASGYRVLGVSQLAAGAGAVWAINPDLSVARINPTTGKRIARIEVTAGSAIAAGKEGVWVVGAGTPRVIRIDPRTNRVAQTISVAADGLTGLAVGGGSVWATDLTTGLLWRIEPGPKPITRTIDVGFGATGVAYGGGAVWVTNFVSDEIVRVDARTNKVIERIPLAGTASSVAATAQTAWVSIAGGSRGDVLPSSACGPVVAGAGEPDVLIASDLPLQGPRGEITRVLADAIRFVLGKHRFRAGTHTVGYQSCDDSTAQTGAFALLKCASNAKAYSTTARVVGVLGPWDSSCAWAQIPITNRAEGPLAMISPSNTHPFLTHGGAGAGKGEPEIYYPSGVRNYARVTAPVDLEGAAAAVLAQELGLRRMFVLKSMEDSGYSELVVPRFRRAAKELGVAIAGTAGWDPDAKSYVPLVERIARARPDGVLIGDPVFQNAGAVIKALRARLGPELVLIIGEGAFVEALAAAGPAAEGMYITNTAAANEGLGPAGRSFLRDFAATQPGREVPSMSYVPEAAQAAEVLLEAIARSDGTRASVNRELRRLKVANGILGSFRFDRNGDVTPTAFTIFRGTGDKGHAPELPDSFAGSAFDRVVHVPAALVTKQ